MRNRLLSALIAILAGPLLAVAVEPDAPAPARPAKIKSALVTLAPSSINVTDESGRKTLWIDYRWKLHQKGSVEVRLIPGKSDKATIATPDFFAAEFFNGKIEERIYKCLDRAGDLPTTDSFTKDKMTYKIVGERNGLGNPAVYVLPFDEGKTPADRPGAVFLQLDAWAVDDHLLRFDLPRDVFAKSGTLFVWFLRGDQRVWEAKVDWPGYGAAK